MNQNQSEQPDDRFVEALLQEHSRIPNGESDRELVHRILLETIHRPQTFLPGKPQHRDWKYLVATAGAAGSIAAVIAVTFISLPSLKRGDASRETEELQFVVHIDAGSPRLPTRQQTPPLIEAAPYRLNAPFSNSAPSPSSPGMAFTSQNDFEWVTNFAPSVPLNPGKTDFTHYENLKITADQSTESGGYVKFSGHVTIEHDRFTIEAEEVTVSKSDRIPGQESYPLNARSAKITQHSPHRVAEAEHLKFAPANSMLILSNVAYLETDAGQLNQFSPNDTVIMVEGGFSVETAKAEKYASPPLLTR
jgi:lipopolysaccharide export system protein LptA